MIKNPIFALLECSETTPNLELACHGGPVCVAYRTAVCYSLDHYAIIRPWYAIQFTLALAGLGKSQGGVKRRM